MAVTAGWWLSGQGAVVSVAAGGAAAVAIAAGRWWWRRSVQRAIAQALRPWRQAAQALQALPVQGAPALPLPADAPQEVLQWVQALNHRMTLVDAQQQAQERFVADAAHQLRTPLAALQTQVEAWALKPPTDSDHVVLSRAQLAQLRQATRRTSQLAHQLLSLSRVDSGLRHMAPSERVDLQSLCEELLESSWQQAVDRGLDVGLEVERVFVSGQAWLLRELVSNLLDNALQYTPPGGHVTLRCGPGCVVDGVAVLQGYNDVGPTYSPAICVEVEDNGPGVPESECAHLTRRFYRVPGTVGEGSGLGLAIAQEIAQGHGARLQFARAHPGGGLRATLVFEG